MSNSTSSYFIPLTSSQTYNHTAWQPTDGQAFDWRSNPYIVTLFRILLVAFFVFLIRIVVQYFRLPGEVSRTQKTARLLHEHMTDHSIAGSQAAVDTVLGGVGLEDLELGLQSTASAGRHNDLPSSGGDRHMRRNDLDNESHE